MQPANFRFRRDHKARLTFQPTHFLWALVLLFTALPDSRAVAQQVSSLPRTEYYFAKELYGAGRIAEAAEGFRVATNRARKIGQKRWVDSIPSMVMLGECFYQQGDLAAALEQYDAALILFHENQDWINQLSFGVEQLPPLEGVAKGIDWFSKSRPSTSVAIPEAVQIAIDPTQAQPGPNGVGAVAPVSLVSRLDATEVLRTMGVALLRRWQIFGPLAKYSPLAEPLAQDFDRRPNTVAPWVQASWSVLAGISQLSTAANADATVMLRQGSLIGQQFDYFMTPLALLTLAEIETKQGNAPDAMSALQDASLVSAYFEQHAELSESLQRLGALACATNRIQLLPPLQRATGWCNKKSLLAFTSGCAATAELAAYKRDFSLAESLIGQGVNAMRSADALLPRFQAQLAFDKALTAFAQNQRAVGVVQLDNALKLMRGSAQTGAVAESVFRIQMTLNLLAGDKISAVDAEQLLGELLQDPGKSDWAESPLKILAALTTVSQPAFERHLELAKLSGDEEQILQRMDRLQRQRLYEALPLGGRLLAWRMAITSSQQDDPPEVKQAVQEAIQRNPDLLAVKRRVADLMEQLKNAPLPLDERAMPSDAKKQYLELERTSARHESQLAEQALMRQAMPRHSPGSMTLAKLRTQLDDDDLLLAFAGTSQALFAVAANKQQIAMWQIVDPQGVHKSIVDVLEGIGLNGQPKTLPSKVQAPDAAWKQVAVQLHDKLQLDQVAGMVNQAKRILVVPHDRLWYLPFELLPLDGQKDRAWLSEKTIVYLPTIGSLEHAYSTHQPDKDTVGVVGRIFAKDSKLNKEIAESVLDALPGSEGVFLGEKVTVATSKWLRLRTDQVWIAARPTAAPSVWDQAMIALPKVKQAKLSSWLETPFAAPKSVLAPAMPTSATSTTLGNGNELFLPSCAMLLSGTKSALLSRWPVGGRSSAILLRRYLEERRVSASSTAWRRSAIALWPEDFLIADEPALLPAGKEASALVKGKHPVLWSAYLQVGDQLPTNPK